MRPNLVACGPVWKAVANSDLRVTQGRLPTGKVAAVKSLDSMYWAGGKMTNACLGQS